ncbi:MAG TPA: hypothetical protein DIU00_06910, partial [Phycisphaerales bacterium]|nr:hypothetical protein [Phycisphaerales bacterium]
MPTKTLKKPEILAADDNSESIVEQAFSKSGLKAGKRGWRTIKNWDTRSSSCVAPLLVAWTSTDIDREKIKQLHELKRIPVFLLFQGNLPVEAVADRIAWLGVRDDRRICLVSADNEAEPFVARFLLALDNGDYEGRIIDARWEEDTLVVVSPIKNRFVKLRVPLEKLSVLQGHNREEHMNFEIDEDGAFIYWPDLDIHLGWEQFEQAIDPSACVKAKQQSEVFNKAYGLAIRELRQKSQLRQSDIKG